MKPYFMKKSAALSACVLLLAGCGAENDALYRIEMVNLTAAQPLSPLSIITQTEGKQWQVGMPASIAVEKLAEGGDNTDWFAQPAVVNRAGSDGPIPPGQSTTVEITSTAEGRMLSMAAMLVNTNDAFVGVTGIDLNDISIHTPLTLYLPALDAGTEANSEAPGSIPGPADGGEGYNADRDDVDYVANHMGIISKPGGLESSTLGPEHRFDNPVVKITISRQITDL